MKSKLTLIILFAVFLGVIVGLVISSNLDLTNRSIAADSKAAKPVLLGAQYDNLDASQVASAEALSKAFAHVAELVKGSVVTIKSTQTVRTEVPEFWQYFFNVPDERIRQGLGSGVIVNPDGYIITNNHVVEGADELQVSIGKDNFDATIVGRDPESDLAVIKIEGDNLNAIKLGDSDDLQVGEWVLAIGNPFAAVLDQTVTAGIVSAKGRTNLTEGRIPFEDFIQTDAAINPGNSGGALVNMRGELVGINTMIYSSSGGNVGIGFAIPINLAKNVMEQLIDKGKVARGWLGVYIGTPDEEMAEALGLDETTGALVNEVTKDSPAEDAGLKELDVILEVDGKKIEDSSHLVNTIANYAPGSDVELLIWRDGREKTITLKLGERPTGGDIVSEEDEDVENLLGIEVDALTRENMRQFQVDYTGEEGVIIINVERESAAAKEGIRPGDLIKSINKEPVKSVSDFNRVVKDIEPNSVVLFRIKRGDSGYFAAIRVPKQK
ncbi:DegQ family serine endoprotease [candidate division KSB1 bacterium]|nr:DegQ family serine endoprotease [candidate division KSB1 bacterium]RQW00574.1 MAG: DegQ family serine endoprotease [candidate division KSB1 bacterium]